VNSSNLTPDWITGFVEGEGCFLVGVMRHATTRTGIGFLPGFRIELQADDLPVLNSLKEYWGFGKVVFRSGSMASYKRAGIKASDHYVYQVTSLRNCLKLASFFAECKFHSKKEQQFNHWFAALKLLRDKEHLSRSGANKILTVLGKEQLK
jgi:hypothetical protein